MYQSPAISKTKRQRVMLAPAIVVFVGMLLLTFSAVVHAFDSSSCTNPGPSTECRLNGKQTVPNDTQAPSAPTGLTQALATETSLTLAWNAASDNVGVVGYHVYEYVRVNQFFSHWIRVVTNTPALTATVSNLAPGTSHKLAVTAFDAVGNESARSLPILATTLKAPTAFHPSSGDVFATVGQLFQYEVDASGVPTPTFSLEWGPPAMTVNHDTGLVEWIPPAESVITDTAIVSATVRASNNVGHDDHTFEFPVYAQPQDVDAPSSVTAITATQITPAGFTLTWSPSSDNVGVAGYKVKVQIDAHGQLLITVGDTASPAAIFDVTGLRAETRYRVWIVAYDAAGNESNISGLAPLLVTTLPDTEPPNPVPSADTTEVSSTGVTLSWAPASDNGVIDGYKVLGQKIVAATTQTPADMFLAAVVSGTVTTATINGLEPSTEYLFWIIAFDTAGNESPLEGSTPVAIKTLDMVPLYLPLITSG
jgi:chitodextrinase